MNCRNNRCGRELPDAARINIRQLQKVEAGEIRLENITLATAVRLAAALGLSLEDLAAGIAKD